MVLDGAERDTLEEEEGGAVNCVCDKAAIFCPDPDAANKGLGGAGGGDEGGAYRLLRSASICSSRP